MTPRLPAPAAAEQVTALLDQLDELRAAATPGPWATDEAHGRDICDEAYSWHAVVQPNGDEVATTWPVGHERHDPAADAALIVAAVNAIPQLVAAVRAGLILADELDDGAMLVRASLAADRLRAALSAPLAGQHTTDEERQA